MPRSHRSRRAEGRGITMTRLCIEDGFEYNLRRTAKQFIRDFDNPEEAIEAIKDGAHLEVFIGYLWDRANEYMNIDELIEEEVRKEQNHE